MKLESQVCSLELAKRLKEFGVEQESLFYWPDSDHVKPVRPLAAHEPLSSWVSAFTVAELGEMLPDFIENHGFMLTKVKHEPGGWWVGYSNHEEVCKGLAFESVKEVDCCAKMLIYLLESKLLTLEKGERKG